MQPSSQLYSLVLGITISLLRERRGLLQNELAEQVALTKAKMSRIEKGQTLVDPLLLQQIATVLGVSREALLSLVDQGIERTKGAVRETLRLSSRQWWEDAQQRAGAQGTVGLTTFAVSLVLADTPGA